MNLTILKPKVMVFLPLLMAVLLSGCDTSKIEEPPSYPPPM